MLHYNGVITLTPDALDTIMQNMVEVKDEVEPHASGSDDKGDAVLLPREGTPGREDEAKARVDGPFDSLRERFAKAKAQAETPED